MKTDNLISVIITVYNSLPYLERCVASVTSQSYSDLEIILINDGSTDGSGMLCDRLAEKDGRIRVIHTENAGVSAARNRGIDEASGKYIAFIDGDDFIYRDMFLIMSERIREDKSSLCICNRLRVGDEEVRQYLPNGSYPIKNALLTREELFREFAGENLTAYSFVTGKLYTREIFDDIRFPKGLIHEDVFTAHHIYDRCVKISCVQYAMYYWYNNENSITNTYSERRFDVLDAYLERFSFFMDKKMTAYAAYTFTGFIWNFNNLKTNYREGSTELLKAYKKRYNSAYLRLLRTLDKSAFNKKYFRFYKERI